MAWRYPPPGGFAGFAQETPAQQAQFGGMKGSSNGGTRRRSRKKKAKASAPRRRKKSSTRKAGTGKGSAAMKRKMARLRKMRKK
jgi:hypothetical protein